MKNNVLSVAGFLDSSCIYLILSGDVFVALEMNKEHDLGICPVSSGLTFQGCLSVPQGRG